MIELLIFLGEGAAEFPGLAKAESSEAATVLLLLDQDPLGYYIALTIRSAATP